MNQSIIRSVIAQYKDDIPAGIVYATAQMAEYFPQLTDDRLIQSTVEGNTFRWQEQGYTAAQWYNFWAEVKKGLEAFQDGVSPSQGVFSPSFQNIEH